MLNNASRRELLNRARSVQFPGSILEVYRAAEQGIDLLAEHESQMQQQEMQVANTPQQQEVGLREEHARGNTQASMAFPNVQPGQSFNTEGMAAPINVDKYNNQGHLVESYKNVPPGIQDLPTGPYEGTVIETPAEYQTGGTKNDRDMVQASNGAMVPRDMLKTYEQSLAKMNVEEFNTTPINETTAGFLPGVGEIVDAKNTIKDLSKGDYLGAGLNAAGFMIPFIPGKIIKGALKKPIKKYLKKFSERTTPVRGGQSFDSGVDEYNSLVSMHNAHPNKVVQPVDLVTDKSGNITGYNMENLEGWQDLSDWSKNNKVSQSMKDEIANTLKDLNSKGIYHGDFKANNIMVGPNGEWKIIDPVGFKHADNLSADMLEEAKKLDLKAIEDVAKYQKGGVKDEEIIYGGMLPEVEVSALTDESYNKLSQPQKQVYDTFVTPQGIAQTVNLGDGRSMHWKGALQMTEDLGVRNIYNKPSLTAKLFPSNFSVRTDDDFRLHVNPILKNVYIPPHSLYKDRTNFGNDIIKQLQNNEGFWAQNMTEQERADQIRRFQDAQTDATRREYFKNLIAEYAHIPELWRKESFINKPVSFMKDAGRLGSWAFKKAKRIGPDISFRQAVDTPRYFDEDHYEYMTHRGPNSFEEQLKSQYEIKQKGGFEDLSQTNYKQDLENVYTSNFKSQKEQAPKDFKKRLRRVESSNGVNMINSTSTATGLYGQLFSEIKDMPELEGITRQDFAADTTLQNQLLDMRWRGDIPGVRGLKDNVAHYRKKYSEQTKDFTDDELAALSHFLGRKGGREYFASIRDNKPFKVPGVNKTPEEYIKTYRKQRGGLRVNSLAKKRPTFTKGTSLVKPSLSEHLESIKGDISKSFNFITKPTLVNTKNLNIRGAFNADPGAGWDASNKSFSPFGSPTLNPTFGGKLQANYKLAKNVNLSGGANFGSFVGKGPSAQPYWAGLNIRLKRGGYRKKYL